MINNAKGYTLLEVSAAIALLSLILMVVFKLSLQGMAFFSEAKAGADVSQNILIAYREIEKQIRNSEAILLPLPGTSSDRLRLKQGAYVWEQLEFYYKAPDQLWHVKNDGHNPVAYGLKQITFSLSGSGKTVAIIIQANGSVGELQPYEGVITLRR